MATVIPFKGIRPARHLVHLVASRSADNYSQKDLNEKIAGNPFTFLHVIHPDMNDGKRTKPGSIERLKKTKAVYLDFHKQGIFVQDIQPCYYIYRQQKQGNVFTGLIGCSSIDDYLNGIIKIHEQTIHEREEKLMRYLEVCDFNAEPVLFSYPNDEEIDQLTTQITEREPEYDFSTTDRVRHTLWIVKQEAEVKKVYERFKTIKAVYIADGHHRSASSALLAKARKKNNPAHTGNEPYNFYMGVFFPESQLMICDYNRVVSDLNGLSEKEFIEKISRNFSVEEKGETIYQPQQKHNFSMYLGGKWYSLTAGKGAVHDEEPVASLDAAILSEHILAPILGIYDLRVDKRIAFVSGIKGMDELKKMVDKGQGKAAFGIYPVQMEQLKQIADTGNVMPPKTTWIEPKMRSGLVIYSLEA
ncbi:MAG: DUF1015 domain-containing protein [Bacteroidota bacterium]